MAFVEFDALFPCTVLIGVLLSTSLLDRSTLFGGEWEGIWAEEGYMHITV